MRRNKTVFKSKRRVFTTFPTYNSLLLSWRGKKNKIKNKGLNVSRTASVYKAFHSVCSYLQPDMVMNLESKLV